jgi:hypothetical protein
VSLPAAAERPGLVRLLADLQSAVEDLLLTGLAAASEASRQTLAVSFEAASRMRLLRLGFTLRVATEELGRFARNEAGFSRRRFGFFLNRAWMLSRGMRQALEQEDGERWRRLTAQPATRAVESLEAVSLGVAKRVVPGTFAAFEFRLRDMRDSSADGAGKGRSLVWSAVFPLRPGLEVPPEAFLHLPQPQGFKPSALLPGRVVSVTNALVSDEGRITLGKDSKVEAKEAPFDDWDRVLRWDKTTALERVLEHRPGPFDLDVELQEEVVLRDFRAGEPEAIEREHQLRHPVTTGEGTFHVLTGTGPEDGALREALSGWKAETQKGPLFGLVHYESCRFVLQPLTLFGGEEPQAVPLAPGTFDAKALVKALRFT